MTFVSLNTVLPPVNQLFAVVPPQAHLHLKGSKREPVSFIYALCWPLYLKVFTKS